MRVPEDLSFDAATSVRPTADPHRFEAHVHELWTVGDKPNGGYLYALLGRAARLASGAGGGPAWEVVSCAITYSAAPDVGPATVTTTPLRRGRSTSRVAVLAQGGHDLVDAVFVLGELPADPRPRYDGIGPLDAPEPGRCVRIAPRIPGGVHVGIMEVLDLRLSPSTLPFTDSPPLTEEARPSCVDGPASPTAGSPTPSPCSSRSTPSRRPPS